MHCPLLYQLLCPLLPFSYEMYCIHQDIGGEDSTGKIEGSQDQDDSDVEVTEDFEGNLEDINELLQQGKSSSEDEG